LQQCARRQAPRGERPATTQRGENATEANKNKGKSIFNVQTVGKEKKRIFLCARVPPRGEAGDIRIWGRRSPRPPLELVVADFLIMAATNSVHAVGIGAARKGKKRIFLCTRFLPRGEAGNVGIGGGALSKASSRTCRR
jgi:hypothetical protein